MYVFVSSIGHNKDNFSAITERITTILQLRSDSIGTRIIFHAQTKQIHTRTKRIHATNRMKFLQR
jgi:hypothetical protein